MSNPITHELEILTLQNQVVISIRNTDTLEVLISLSFQPQHALLICEKIKEAVREIKKNTQ